MSNDAFLTNLSAFDTLSPATLRDKFRASIVMNEAKKEDVSTNNDALFSPERQQMLTQARVLNGLLISPSTKDNHIGQLATAYVEKKKEYEKNIEYEKLKGGIQRVLEFATAHSEDNVPSPRIDWIPRP
jgi:hypothetical protein